MVDKTKQYQELQKPPEILYHGTSEKAVDSINKIDIQKQSRHHVHLSENVDTAHKVGQRHGNPIVLFIDAEQMYNNGFQFFLSDNGVWLTDNVPTEYINNFIL